MNGNAAAALLQMGFSITRPMAEHWARLAVERGATDAEAEEALMLWDEEQAASLQVIHSDPRPGTLCLCADPASWHHEESGKCLWPGCGCLWMRPGGGRTA